MTDPSRTTGDDRSQGTPADGFGRREFVALGAGVGATMLAGCAGDGGLTSSDGSDGSQTLTGNFRLLISDAPADIADFDRLDVTLDRARIFEARDEDDEEDEDEEEEAEDDDAEEADQTGNETDTESDAPNGTADEEDDADDAEEEDDAEEDEENEEDDAEEDEEDGEDENDEEDRGFTVVDLGGETVDLTRVVGDDATTVFDGEIPAGSYEKIELEVSAVEGIVDGAEVDVKLPSEKLQITNEFEVTADEPVSFVFDINVVKRGKNNGYILKPVISGSGVAGRDVDVNEIDDDDDEADEDEDDSEEDESDEDADETEDGGDDSDGEEDADDTTSGNETDDTENETTA